MAILDDKKKRQAVTLPATGALVPEAPPAPKRSDPFNPALEPAANGAGGGRVAWGLNQPYVDAAGAGRPVMAGTTTVPGAKPMRTLPAGDAPGTKAVTVAPARPAPPRTLPARAAAQSAPASNQDMTATVGGGGDASKSYFIGSNGIRRSIAKDGTVAGVDPTLVTVNRQSFGGDALPVRRSLGGRQVASTYGQPVTSMQDDAVTVRRGLGGAFRSPDSMATYNASKEDRDLRNKLLSDMDSQRFRLEMVALNPGRRGRAATAALERLNSDRAALIGGAEKASSDRMTEQERAAAGLEKTGMEEQGANRRAELDAANRFDIASMNDATNREQIAAGQITRSLQTDAKGNLVNVTGTRAEQVLDADGNPVAMPQAKDAGQVTPDAVLKSLDAREAAILGAGVTTEGGVDKAALAEVRAQRAQLLGTNGAKPQGAKQAPTLDQFMSKARQVNPGVSDDDLRAYYNQNYGSR